VINTALTAEVVRASTKRGANPEVAICVREPGLAVPVGTLAITYSVNGKDAATESVPVQATDLGRLAVAIPVKIAKKGGSFDIEVAYQSAGGGAPVVSRARYVPSVSAKLTAETVAVGKKPKIRVTVKGAGVARASGTVKVVLRSQSTGKVVSTVAAVIKKPALTAKVALTLPALKKAGQYTATVTYRGNRQLASVVVQGRFDPGLSLTAK
jgi:hypothetical protein